MDDAELIAIAGGMREKMEGEKQQQQRWIESQYGGPPSLPSGLGASLGTGGAGQASKADAQSSDGPAGQAEEEIKIDCR